MPFDQNQLPTWNKEGVEPPQSLKDNGWQPSQKPPADYFNWFFNKVYKALQSLFVNAQHKEEKGKPNGYAALNADGKVVNADGSLAGSVQSVNGRTGIVNLTASDVGAETPTGAQTKANQAETNAKAYADQKVNEHSADTAKHVTDAERAAWNSAEQNAKTYTDQKTGNLTMLNTTAKTNLVAAVNELFTNVSNGKIQVRDAITGKGGTVADADGDGIPTFTELVNGINGLGGIKSIQQGRYVVPYDKKYVDIPITAVDPQKSLYMCDWATSGSYGMRYNSFRCYLLNSTTLRIERNQPVSNSGNYAWYEVVVVWKVIEFSNVKRKQEGMITFTPGDLSSVNNARYSDTTITSVNPSKCIMRLEWTSDETAGKNVGTAMVSWNALELINATTLRFWFGSDQTNYSIYMTWQIIEFN